MKKMLREMKINSIISMLHLILVWIFTGNAQRQAKEFVSKLSLTGQDRLVLDYQKAWRGSRTLRGDRSTLMYVTMLVEFI